MRNPLILVRLIDRLYGFIEDMFYERRADFSFKSSFSESVDVIQSSKSFNVVE